jgi:hypothetical protein
LAGRGGRASNRLVADHPAHRRIAARRSRPRTRTAV